MGIGIFTNGELTDYALIEPKKSRKVTELVYKYDSDKHAHYLTMSEEMYKDIEYRITVIVDTFTIIFEKEKPDIIYLENVYQSKNAKSVIDLARLQGFIMHLCHINNTPYVIVEENKWICKWGKYGRIKRKERKKDIMQKVNEMYNLNITKDDISDAIGIGRYAIAQEEKEN